MSFQAPSFTSTQTRVCQHCDLAVEWLVLEKQQSAYCPRCNTQLYRGSPIHVERNLALALACIVLLYPALFHPFLSIRLIGEMITASLWDGIVALFNEGFASLAFFVGLTTIITPISVLAATLTADWSLRTLNNTWLKRSLRIIHYFKHWMMLDVFLISIAISSFKLQDYADLHFRPGLIFLGVLQILMLLLISRLSNRRYWEVFDLKSGVESRDHSAVVETKPETLLDCPHCHLTQFAHGECDRCGTHIKQSNDSKMIRTTWLYLLIATIAIIPANLVPISILITNGQRLEDTILSGIASLIENGMSGIALIIFVASILVPIFKILGIAYLLLAVQFDRKVYHKQRMGIYFVVKWIGKWSMMDILVIAIMLTLVDRGQILNFTPGFGAIAFGVVVVFTMLATETLKPNFIWRNINEKEL